MKTFNIIKFENIFLIILICFLANISFSTNQAEVKNIYIELELKGNADHRTMAIEESYKIALSRYLKWITLKETSDIINLGFAIALNLFAASKKLISVTTFP